MAAVDFLPIAQPAARPEQAGARKLTSAPSETGEASFANMLETEIETGFESETLVDPAAPVDVSAASIPPAPAPVVSSVNTATAAIAAVLHTPTAPHDGEAPAGDAGTQPTTAASPGTRTASAMNPQTGAETMPTPASAAPAPAAAAATPAGAGTSNSVADIPTAPAAASSASIVAAGSSEPATIAAASIAKASSAKQAVVDQASPEPSADADPLQTAPDESVATGKPAHPASPAPEIVAATPASDVAVQVVAAVAGGQAQPKPVAPSTPFENAPGQRRKTNGESATITDAATTASSKPGVQPAQPGVSPARPANGYAKLAMQAAADAATPDVKADATARSSINTSTSPSSTSFADALAAARGQSAEGGRAQAASPHLQSAPSAAVQVYTRFVERFDGRAQRFEVRLDPAELGRVDVRIEVGADKKVHAVLAAHDSAALTDLMRGQRALERALSDAGIDLADNGLRFELSQDSSRNLAGQQRGDGQPSDELAHVWRGFSTVDVAADADAAAATRSYSRRASRLNLVA